LYALFGVREGRFSFPRTIAWKAGAGEAHETATQGSCIEPMSTTASAPTTNQRLLEWVGEIASLTEPADIYWCDGSTSACS
jgi:hypothetical protein